MNVEASKVEQATKKSVHRLAMAGLVVSALGILILVVWMFFGGGSLRGRVASLQASLLAPNLIALAVDSCDGEPEVAVLEESDSAVSIGVVASSRSGSECLDVLEIMLARDLDGRTLSDAYTGQTIPLVNDLAEGR